jgi:hypothetical protein
MRSWLVVAAEISHDLLPISSVETIPQKHE